LILTFKQTAYTVRKTYAVPSINVSILQLREALLRRFMNEALPFLEKKNPMGLSTLAQKKSCRRIIIVIVISKNAHTHTHTHEWRWVCVGAYVYA